MMDQPLYLLLGIGVLIAVLSFFLKKSGQTATDPQALLVQKQAERAEMEKSLQRFVKQVKQENEQTISGIHESQHHLERDVHALRNQLQELQGQFTTINERISQRGAQPEKENAEAPIENDTLMLRERYRRVFELKQQGLSINEIAKKLGAGRGEIELIFSLASPDERGISHD